MSDQAEKIDVEEPQAAPSAPPPLAETAEGEPFDLARAMRTIEKLRAEIKELKPRAKLAEELSQAEQQRKEAEMTELQKLQAKLEKAEAELQAARMAELRRQAAEEVELPLIFADRLRGETLEDLKADAKKIMEALPKVPKPPPVSPTAPGAGASQAETTEQQRARIYGQSINVLEPGFAQSHGGGVVWKEDQQP